MKECGRCGQEIPADTETCVNLSCRKNERYDQLAQENTALITLLTDIGNEYFDVNSDGSFSGNLSVRLNNAIGI
jgi:predicted nucleic acid-binding Zn ribbon protein